MRRRWAGDAAVACAPTGLRLSDWLITAIQGGVTTRLLPSPRTRPQAGSAGWWDGCSPRSLQRTTASSFLLCIGNGSSVVKRRHVRSVIRSRHRLQLRLRGNGYELLLALIAEPERVFTRETLLRSVWGLACGQAPSRGRLAGSSSNCGVSELLIERPHFSTQCGL
jgi:hypothetical protein